MAADISNTSMFNGGDTKRSLVQIFPVELRKLWTEWELRSMVLLSLWLQILLIHFGSQRKFTTRKWVRPLLWISYLSADWVAAVCLGTLANAQGESPAAGYGTRNDDDELDPGYVMKALWAPFLLLHLGGPDTITAYALEDNELWLRHLLGLIVEVGVAFYVFVKSLVPAGLNFVAVPVFVAGIIKYGERTWALRSGSYEHFRESLPPYPKLPNPPDDLVCSTSLEEDECHLKRLKPLKRVGDDDDDAMILKVASFHFKAYKCLFAELILNIHSLGPCCSFFWGSSWDASFAVIETELELAYDIFYTKAAAFSSRWGVMLRLVAVCSSVAATAAFCIVNKHGYSQIDIAITLLLLGGAIGLEIYAVLVQLSSDRAKLWMNEHNDNKLVNALSVVLSPFNRVLATGSKKQRWSNSMLQLNLLNVCIEKKKQQQAKLSGGIIRKCATNIGNRYGLVETSCTNRVEVPSFLKESIFQLLVENSRPGRSDTICPSGLCAARGDRVLRRYDCLRHESSWSITEVDFDHSILLWHVATHICYNSDKKRDPASSVEDPNCKISKLVSDYLVHILVSLPFMLPHGIGQVRFRHTCGEVEEFSEELGEEITVAGWEKLLESRPKQQPANKSVLLGACGLARRLQGLEMEGRGWNATKKWELMGGVWVEMLSYAAAKCRWTGHAQQLRRGGELLTHVWLLMSHLGITEQFR